MPQKILIIEDNKDLAKLVAMNLKDLDFEVDLADDGSVGLRMAQTNSYDLIILDIMLPGLDGLEICRNIRAQSYYTPIMMLTSKSSELDRVLGLELGADDYVTKPFSIPELMARTKAILRRVDKIKGQGEKHKTPEGSLHHGGLRMELDKRQVFLNEKSIDLTAKEFDLLLHFARNPGRVYTRIQLLDAVWGYGHDGYEHTVNSHMNRLRSKIEEDPSHPKYILTVWGVGYKFTDKLADPQN